MSKAANTGNGYPSGMKNRIINGGMDIAQRGTSFVSPADSAYSLDRWRFSNGTDGAVTITQNSDAPSNNEFQNSLRLTVTTADTSLGATQRCSMIQFIEGYNIRDLIGRTFTLSFWVKSTKTGIHCVSFRNSVLSDRSYVAECNIIASNTWEYKTITVSGGLTSGGTWNYTNGQGIQLTFHLADGGALNTGSTNTWLIGSYTTTSNQVNCLDTIGNIFAITGVQLELGPVATPFEHRLYGAELALCQRYYCTTRIIWRGNSGASNICGTYFSFPVNMRATPASISLLSTLTRGNITSMVYAGVTSGGSYGTFIQATCTVANTDSYFAEIIEVVAEL